MTESDVPSTGAAPVRESPEPTAGAGADAVPLEGVAVAAPEPAGDPGTPHPTAPVTGRPVVRPRRSGPVTRMGPWAPVAGALLGAALGLVAVLLLAGQADNFRERLALVLLVIGTGLLGAAGPLLADEVRLVRLGVREAAVRPASVEVTAALLNGLTPARLLLLVSGFVLFLAAYVGRG